MEKNDKQTTETQSGVQINIPTNLPILYTDSVLISTNQFGIVLDFAQSVASVNQQSVVARLGMSKEHAEKLLQVLQERLETESAREEIKEN